MLVCQLRQINRKFPAPPYNSAKAKSSGGTHDCQKNRKSSNNEALEILAFIKNAFKLENKYFIAYRWLVVIFVVNSGSPK